MRSSVSILFLYKIFASLQATSSTFYSVKSLAEVLLLRIFHCNVGWLLFGLQQNIRFGLLPDPSVNPLNSELNPIRHLLALAGARHFVHVSRVRLTLYRPKLSWIITLMFFISCAVNDLQLFTVSTKAHLYYYVLKKQVESFEMWCWRRMEKTSWTDHVRNEEVLLQVNEQRNILHTIRKRKANWIGHILRINCLLKQVI